MHHIPIMSDRRMTIAPIFFNFFTWKHLSTFLETMEKGLIPFIEWGYLVLIATLTQAVLLSLILILLPLLVLPKKRRTSRVRIATIVLFYLSRFRVSFY